MLNQQLTVGIDAGTSSIKAAAMLSNGGNTPKLLAECTEKIRSRNVYEVVKDIFAKLCDNAKIKKSDIDYLASTGDGDTVPFRTGHFYGMTTHSRGAVFFNPSTRAVLDIGALHARAITINEEGRVLNQRMTSQCASGSGQFLENIARYLGVPLEDVGEISCQAKMAETVSSICAVLAETDVINMVSRGISAADILKGIHLSITGRLLRLLRAIGAEGTVLITGGLSKDAGMLQAFNDQLEVEAKQKIKRKINKLNFATHSDCIMAGAYGAAILGAYRFEQLKKMGRLQRFK